MNDKMVLVWKYGVSRGQYTYGYTLVSLYVDGKKVAKTGGGGYDMKGATLGEWITDNFQDELKKLTAHYGSNDKTDWQSSFYGLKFYGKDHERHNKYQDGDSVSFDGACGFSECRKVLEALGYSLEYIHDTNKEVIYTLTKI